MTRAIDLLGDAFAMARRERDLVLALAGPFLFLPLLALQLLTAPMPAPPETTDEAAIQKWLDVVAAWGQSTAPWYLLGQVVGLFGMATLAILFVGAARPTVSDALQRAAGLMPRLVLLGVLISFTVGPGMLLFVLPGLFLQARFSAAVPIAVQGGRSAAASMAESWRRTRGASFAGFGAMVALFTAEWLLAMPLQAIDAFVRAPAHLNPFVLALADAGLAAILTLHHVGVLLVGLALYRRFPSRGI